jgi:hypothetical protein
MRKALRAAAASDPDYYLLLNDHTIISPEALEALLEIYGANNQRRITVAAICDPKTGKATYGCWNRLNGFRDRPGGLVPPDSIVRNCETLNAN